MRDQSRTRNHELEEDRVSEMTVGANVTIERISHEKIKLRLPH